MEAGLLKAHSLPLNTSQFDFHLVANPDSLQAELAYYRKLRKHIALFGKGWVDYTPLDESIDYGVLGGVSWKW